MRTIFRFKICNKVVRCERSESINRCNLDTKKFLNDRSNIDWRKEYRVSSFYDHKIRNNKLVVLSKGGKNPYNFVVRIILIYAYIRVYIQLFIEIRHLAVLLSCIRCRSATLAPLIMNLKC